MAGSALRSAVSPGRQLDAFIIFCNIASSTGLVLLNKYIVNTLGFDNVALLTAFHFASGALLLEAASRWRHGFRPKRLPLQASLKIGLAGSLAIVLSNLSLQFNSVGSYQMFKLLCIPLTVAVLFLFYRRSFSLQTLCSLVLLVLGVWISTVSDVDLNATGVLCGLAATLITTFNQVFLDADQKRFRLSGVQMLHAVLPFQAVGAALLSLSRPWPLPLLQQPAVGGAVALSCLTALLSNVSGTALVGRTSAVTYQVVGQAKTVLTVLLGLLLPGPAAGRARHAAAMGVALAGVAWYAYSRHAGERDARA